MVCIYFPHQEKLKLVTVLGAGLLCGTALAVIIPEGIHALYEEILEGTEFSKPQTPCVLLKGPTVAWVLARAHTSTSV